VRWVVERCAELWGEGFAWEADTGTHPHEAQYLRLDCTRARTKLGWQPRWDVTQALSTTLAWYKIAQRSRQDARELLLEQLEAYQAPVEAGKV